MMTVSLTGYFLLPPWQRVLSSAQQLTLTLALFAGFLTFGCRMASISSVPACLIYKKKQLI